MDIKQKIIKANGIILFIEDGGKEIAHAYLYILKNIHDQPFGFMEDIFVDESFRNKGLGTKLIEELIKAAKQNNCYKLIGNSRQERVNVHSLYMRLGFKDWGKEFRMDM
ncbi:MAG: GNAT family N-acetyltransferase [bacterium]|nr:GNAT family N-acetyltransferase [bacterium]